MKNFKITYKTKDDDRMHYTSVFANSLSQAKEKAKSMWGDIKIVSCVEN